jgi:mitochondrial chaperone BCS1
MEDIDAAFHRGLSRDTISSEKDPADGKKGNEPNQQQQNKAPPEAASRITLSGLLNALDGVGAQEGRLLFATTNKYSVLDPALCRPGRMDLHIEFKLASKYQAEELFKCFYVPSDAESSTAPADTTAAGDEESETGSVDSGYNSVAGDKPAEAPTSLPSQTDATSYTGISHRLRAPLLSLSQVSRLAKTFCDTIPDREFSMASLQGYLMTYKTRPLEAAREVGTWIEKERAEKAAKLKAAAAASSSTESKQTPETTTTS